MPNKREILYPIFLECFQFCTDVFWESIFEELAYGKSPYGTYISKGFLCCCYKNKEFTYKIERKDSKILYDEIYKLLTEKIGILSYKEKTQKKIDFHEIEKNIKNSRQEWGNIRKKNIKDVMYERYVIEMKHKYSLSYKQCKHLLSVIIMSIIFKTITSKDIIYTEDKIQNISGIEFEKGKVIFKKPLCSISEIEEIDNAQNEQDLQQTIYEKWEKYLDTLRV